MDNDKIVEELAKTLKCSHGEVLAKVQKIETENQRLKDKIEALKDFVNECVTYHG